MQRSPKTIAKAFTANVKAKGIETVNAVIDELSQMAKAIRILKLISHFKNPTLSLSQKEEWLKKIGHELKAGEASQRMAMTLLMINQLNSLPKVVAAMKEIRASEFGVGEGEVVTMTPLSSQQKQTVTDLLKKMSGLKEVIVIEKTNPNILGGISVSSGDKLVDATLQRQLKNMLKLVS